MMKIISIISWLFLVISLFLNIMDGNYQLVISIGSLLCFIELSHMNSKLK